MTEEINSTAKPVYSASRKILRYGILDVQALSVITSELVTTLRVDAIMNHMSMIDSDMDESLFE